MNPVAGDGTAGTTNDAVPAGQARFMDPTGLVAIPGGGFYVYDASACAIYEEHQGEVSLAAGTPGTCGNSGDGGPATQATLDNVASADPDTVVHGPGRDMSTPLALGTDGSLYFVQRAIVDWASEEPDFHFPAYQSQVRRIDPDGTIDTVGDVITHDFSRVVSGITTTPMGTILVAVSDAAAGTATIDQITSGGAQSTIRSIPTVVYGIAAISETDVAILSFTQVDRLDLSTGALAPTGQPTSLSTSSLAATPDGTIYVGNTNTNTVVRIAPDDTVAVIAGDGTADSATGTQTGAGLALHLTPTGLALTPNDGLLISSGHVVYRLTDPAAAPH